jgi:hypothetical protein
VQTAAGDRGAALRSIRSLGNGPTIAAGIGQAICQILLAPAFSFLSNVTVAARPEEARARGVNRAIRPNDRHMEEFGCETSRI